MNKSFFVKLLVVVVLLGGTGLTVYLLYINKPNIGRTPRPKMAVTVDALAINKGSEAMVVKVMGTVIPVRQVAMKARVSGLITELVEQFRPGGYLSAGQTVLSIDKSDYQLTVNQTEAQLANAQGTLALEQGKQEVARREWELVNAGKDYTQQEKALALRQPQLRQAQAAVDIAISNVENARLDLERTEVKAPFNCVVLTKNVDLGTNVSTSESLASVVDVDKFWIEASVPLDDLKWLEIPHLQEQAGSPAKVIYGNGQSVEGRVVTLLTDLEAKGHMARVLVEVSDPLALKDSSRTPLLLGDYVHVEIYGKKLDNIVRIPRVAWREGNRIWLAVKGDDGYKLEIRDTQSIFRDETTVVVAEGLNEGELLITTPIASPVSGMTIKLAQADAEPVKQAEVEKQAADNTK